MISMLCFAPSGARFGGLPPRAVVESPGGGSGRGAGAENGPACAEAEGTNDDSE